MLPHYFGGEVVDIEDPLFEGRVKVKVFGKFDDIPTSDIPWARCQYRNTAGSATGSGFHSVPKIGAIVGINFDNGNLYEPEYYCMEHVSDELKSEIEDYQLRIDEGGDLQWEDLD